MTFRSTILRWLERDEAWYRKELEDGLSRWKKASDQLKQAEKSLGGEILTFQGIQDAERQAKRNGTYNSAMKKRLNLAFQVAFLRNKLPYIVMKRINPCVTPMKKKGFRYGDLFTKYGYSESS